MRVRYGELRASERAALARLDARIDAFFSAALESDVDAAGWQRRASRIARGLAAERGSQGALIVRAESPELIPIAERVAARAPAGLPVSSRRPPRDLASALAALRNGLAADFGRARFRAGFARGHLLELVLYLPGGSGDAREDAAAERLVWDVLGEHVADTWIGEVRTAAEPRGGPLRVLPNTDAPDGGPRLALEQLAETVHAGVRGLYAALPAEPAWARADREDWVLLEVEPDPSDECAAQDDLMIAATRDPELLKCFLAGEPFSSARFSRHGESCFYLKLAAEGELERRLRERSALEDAFDAALVEARAGRVTGGGLGLRHSYVNFVFSECERGFAIVKAVARELSLPERCWILPFDDALAAEWLEIWPEAPPPPGFSF